MSSVREIGLSSSCHGKSEVRVAKVTRHEGGVQDIIELSVTLKLYGGTDNAFLQGDNSGVVSTDTCRNHVYMHAKKTQFSTCEQFALGLADRMLTEYAQINQVQIWVTEKPWRRAVVNSEHHRHGFIDTSTGGTRGCNLSASRHEITLHSLLTNLSVLKTTQSGWENYINDKYTTLPQTKERILASTINAKWMYEGRSSKELLSVDFEQVQDQVRSALLINFFGPPEKGVYSPGVQRTLFAMGQAVLRDVPQIAFVTLSLPNLHFLPCNLPVFEKNGLQFKHDVFIPTSEPYGLISATICKSNIGMAKL